MQPSEKRVALVTGANSGIGYEIARQLAVKGLTVVLGARNKAKGVEACRNLADQGLDVHFSLLDVTDATSIRTSVGWIAGTFGRLDVLVNNAGIMIDGHDGILGLGLGLLQTTLNTNVFGPLLLSQGSVLLMKKHHYGRIVNISSSYGSLAAIGDPGSNSAEVRHPAYRMSKTLLNALTALLARELQGTDILVNSACPGWVRTNIGGPSAPLSPEAAADTPVWLASLPADGPTGGFFRERKPVPW